MKNAPYFLSFPICRRRMAGFGLVELMISITIGLVVIAALIGVLISSRGNSRTNDLTAELQENGRYALEHLVRELRHAGFRGYTWVAPEPTTLNVENECLVAGAAPGSFVNKISQGIWGANDANLFTALDCLGDYVRGDVLVVRRVGMAANGLLEENELYFRSTYLKGEMFQATAGQNATEGNPIFTCGETTCEPLADFPVQEYVYYIGREDCDVGGDVNQSALCRLALQGNAFVKELVVNGIEQLQVQYGRTPSGSNTTQFFNADQIKSDAEWDEVSSVRIYLLSKSSKTELGYTNNEPYSLGDWSRTFNDNFRRQVFTSTVRVRNFQGE